MKLLQTLTLSAFQKQVIAKIVAAPTPKKAATDIAANHNLQTARNLLANLGIITFTENEAHLTELGTNLAVEEDIAYESGQLTDAGQALVGGAAGTIYQPTDPSMGMDDMSLENPEDDALDVPPPPPTATGGARNESLTLLQQVLRM